jgi:membrane fusion protein, multidrug efflux system
MFAVRLASRTALLLPLLTALALAGCGDAPQAEAVRPAMVVQPGGSGDGLTAYAGEVHAREEPELSFRVGGKIARRLVDAGAHVVAGQPMAELDASDLNLQQQAYRAALSSSQSDLALAKTELDRYKALLDQQLVSRSLYDTKKSAFDAAAARVRQSRAQASVYGNQADYAVLRAPRAGIIARRLAEAGQVVAAGQTIFVLAVDGDREVAISVPEQSVDQFKVGRALAVELWATPGKRYPATLREIAPAADPVTRTYAGRVTFATDGGAVDLGQSARVYAQAAGRSALGLPLSALIGDKDRAEVWVVDPKTATVRRTPVRVGPFGEETVPVLSGVQAGDWVVAAGGHLLRDGEHILPIDRENRPVALTPAPAAAR